MACQNALYKVGGLISFLIIKIDKRKMRKILNHICLKIKVSLPQNPQNLVLLEEMRTKSMIQTKVHAHHLSLEFYPMSRT